MAHILGSGIHRRRSHLFYVTGWFAWRDARRKCIRSVPHLIFAEPFFLNFNADLKFRIAMTANDLAKAELDKLGEHWK
jgi:hypothetical protein